jgi:hypothetical protein
MDTGDEQTKTASQIMADMQALTNLHAKGLAELIGVSPSTVTRIRAAKVCPSYDDMMTYIRRAGYMLDNDGALVRAKHLRGYRSAKEIGDFVNDELKEGLDEERLRVLLRTIPKLVLDWSKLPREDVDKMMAPRANIEALQWQALVEATVQYFAHTVLWEDAPAWTHRTKLDEMFVPRSVLREIGPKRFSHIAERAAPEFMDKNILFSHREMQLI